ncbi:hypothetical protein FA13DRAFT_1731977 [Coprinellus micaceus]|uniref:Uncharacterized protein n=1 Tax=Coprinellus micaceus TaxID=71717 RepID=A0A4Y7TDH6_COPMI|nr:hypothetical protein FA13DRAFT_1731977 [Coprinellus micaceus]
MDLASAGIEPPTTRWEDQHDIHGPRFVSNLDGLVLEISSNERTISSRQFTGDRAQQWVFQRGSTPGRVALVSLHDGRYLSASSSGERIAAARRPFYWVLVPVGVRRYRLCTPRDLHLTLPTPPGACSASPPLIETEAQTTFIFLGNSSHNQETLKTGSIGERAYPGVPVYYTYAPEGQIIVRNHLDTVLYGAVSGPGNNSQWPIAPGHQQHWYRSADERIHISTAMSDDGEQTAQVYEARVGMVLHIQTSGRQEKWRGIRFVSVEEARYTGNSKSGSIGIKNDLGFDIFVSVFSTIQNGDTSQYKIKPNSTSYWTRSCPESVFVGVGSAPGLPQAYVGRPGFILHIEDRRARGVQ